MTSLCSIFTDALGFNVRIGRMVVAEPGEKRAPLVMFDLAALIPLCRTLSERMEQTMSAAGIPYEDAEAEMPFIESGRLQVGSRQRTDLGALWTMDEEHGRRMVQLRIDVEAMLAKYDYLGVHIHEETPDEIAARRKAREGAQEPPGCAADGTDLRDFGDQ